MKIERRLKINFIYPCKKIHPVKMKKILCLKILFFSFSINSFCQGVIQNDSLEIIKVVNKVFKTFEKSNYKDFQKISVEKIYCILCSDEVNSKFGPYMTPRNDFFYKYSNSIKNFEGYQEALKLKGIKLRKEDDFRSDIIVLITTFERDKWKKGYEGEQLGIYLKKVKGEYKFAGIETIP